MARALRGRVALSDLSRAALRRARRARGAARRDRARPGLARRARLHAEAMLLDGDGVFVAAYGSRKADYCSCSFYIWAADVARAEQAKERLLDKAGSTRITEPMFSIDWHFLTAQRAAERGDRGDGERRAARPRVPGDQGRRARLHRALPRRAGDRAGAAGAAGHRQDPPDPRHPRRDVAPQDRRRGSRGAVHRRHEGAGVRRAVRQVHHRLARRLPHRGRRPPAEAARGRQRAPAPLPHHRGRRGALAGPQDHLLDQSAERRRPGRGADPARPLLRARPRAQPHRRGSAGAGRGDADRRAVAPVEEGRRRSLAEVYRAVR